LIGWNRNGTGIKEALHTAISSVWQNKNMTMARAEEEDVANKFSTVTIHDIGNGSQLFTVAVDARDDHPEFSIRISPQLADASLGDIVLIQFGPDHNFDGFAPAAAIEVAERLCNDCPKVAARLSPERAWRVFERRSLVDGGSR